VVAVGGTLQAARNCIEGNNREVEGEREGGREKERKISRCGWADDVAVTEFALIL
jgi:hypothetical protein